MNTKSKTPTAALLLRTIRFSPYRKGAGPAFTLTMWDAGTTDGRGSTTIRYRLTMRENGKTIILFNAADYHGSPAVAIDSDENAAGLMGFLTLRPGDTDSEFFADDSAEVRAYRGQHAEALSLEVMDRLGEY